MLIGILRESEKPSKLIRMISKSSKYYGVEIIYFTPNDIDKLHGHITAKKLINNKWKSITTTIPNYIDINPPILNYPEVFQYLNDHSTLSLQKEIGIKPEVNQKIKELDNFSDLVIPFDYCESKSTIKLYLKRYGKVILKPNDGIHGNGIYQLQKQTFGYLLTYGTEQHYISPIKLSRFLNKYILNQNYMIQKFIHSRAVNGDPFDVRARLEKGSNGRWIVATNFVRIGTNKKVVSNVSQGGSVSKLKPFLQANFPEQSEFLRNRIKEISQELPPKIEEICEQDLSSLGLDIGIEPDGSMYLFEVETDPGRLFAEGEIANLKADYYNYIQNKLSEVKK